MKKFLLIILGMLFGIICFSNTSYAGSQKWNALNYNVSVNSDGSMEVVETWDIYVSETNTLFKQFKIDNSKYSGITDIEVIQISPIRMELKQIYQEQNHVDSGCFYALEINPSTFEIAWNVGLDYYSANRIYELHYTIKDAVKIYNDCTELYWMFLDRSNLIPADKVNGTITLPKPVTDIEKLRIWGHGTLNAKIEKTSENTVVFEANNFQANTMLEVRIVTEENVYLETMQKSNIDKLNSILKEEQKWAFSANLKRNISKFIRIFIFIIWAGSILFLAIKIIQYIKDGKNLKNKYKDVSPDFKYFRNIPNEKNATPARAAYLYYFEGNSSAFKQHISKILTATILDLTVKGIFELKPIDKNDFKIFINREKRENILLSSDEKIVYKLIDNAAGNKDSITMKKLSEYAKINYEYFYKAIGKINDKVIEYQRKSQNIDSNKEKMHEKSLGAIITYLLLLAFLTGFGTVNECFLICVPLFVEFLICIIICYMNLKKICILSEKGREEEKQWKALKRYMDDFSLLKQKEVPDIILWEKFLVYATVFGISKEVIKQLKVVYPELRDNNLQSKNKYAYINYVCDLSFGDDIINSFDKEMDIMYNSCASSYSATHTSSSSSSGSGDGGGFSDGGGGRRRWRPVAVEDRVK